MDARRNSLSSRSGDFCVSRFPQSACANLIQINAGSTAAAQADPQSHTIAIAPNVRALGCAIFAHSLNIVVFTPLRRSLMFHFYDGYHFIGMHILWWGFWILFIGTLFGAYEPVRRKRGGKDG
jgi:hypothetical protein